MIHKHVYLTLKARYKLSLVREAVSAYEEVAAKYEMTPTQLALAWCKSR